MKKSLLKGVTLLVSLAFLAGCGNNNNVDTPDEPDNPSEPVESGIITEATEINLWSIIGSNNQPYLNQIIEDFKKVEPNVTVTSTIISGSYSDLKEATIKGFTANNYPDLIQCYPDHVAEYLNYGKAVNLEPYMNDSTYGWSDSDFEDIIEEYLQEGQEYATEGTYSLPFCKSTEEMFYNEDVLIGLDLSSVDSTINNGNPLTATYLNNLTWDELFDKLCPAIVAYDEKLPEESKLIKTDDVHAVFAYDSDDNLFITLAKQYGYDFTSVDKSTGKASVLFNNDGMKSILRKFNAAAQKGYIVSKGSYGDYTNNLFTKQCTLFSVGSTGGVKYQFSDSNPMNVGVARIPQADTSDPWVINQGPSLAVLDHNDENRKLASWLFYRFLTNESNSLYWSINTGYSVIRYSNFESDEYLEAADWQSKDQKTLDRVMAKSIAGLENVGQLFVSPAFKGSSTCRDQAGGLMTKALTTSNNIEEIDQWFEDAVAVCKLAL